MKKSHKMNFKNKQDSNPKEIKEFSRSCEGKVSIKDSSSSLFSTKKTSHYRYDFLQMSAWLKSNSTRD